MAGETIEQFYVDGFIANLNNAPQQMGARLVTCVDADLAYAKHGQMFNADDIQADDGEVLVTERAPDSPSSFSTNVRRVGFFTAHNFGRFIDNLDTVRMLDDPTNPTMRGMMAARARATDDAIIAALTGSAREGATGGTTVAYDTTNQQIAADNREFLHAQESSVVAGSGDLPLTVGKLIKARTILEASELEGDMCFAASAYQLGNLLSSTAVTSSDYNMVKALVNGETNMFGGFTFVRTERLPKTAANRTCIAWKQSALVYRERPIINARITQREDKSYRWYAYYEVERGGVRRYDKGVVTVLCKEG